MNKILLIILIICGMFSTQIIAKTVQPKIVEGNVTLGRSVWFNIEGDRGIVKVNPIKSGPITWRIEFTSKGWTTPSANDYADSQAIYTKERGLVITSGEHLSFIAKIDVPVDQPLKLNQGSGSIVIGKFTGEIIGKLKVGRLTYDASDLPEDTCIKTVVEQGNSTNEWKNDPFCENARVKLYVHIGHLKVERTETSDDQKNIDPIATGHIYQTGSAIRPKMKSYD